MTQPQTWKSDLKNRPQTFLTNIGPLSKTSWTEKLRNRVPSKPTLPTLPTNVTDSLTTMSDAVTSQLQRMPSQDDTDDDDETPRRPRKQPRSVPLVEIHTHRHPASLFQWIKQVGGAAGVGVAAMYFLDPDRGAARRARVRDQLLHAQHDMEHGLDTLSRDLRNRVAGVGAGVRYRVTGRKVDDTVLTERVRARLGLVAGHPKAIDVSTASRVVRLSGDVLAEEHHAVVRAASRVPGVKKVDDQLRMHASADGVPGLQGPSRTDRRSTSLQHEVWSPSTRLVGGAAGIGLLGAGRQIGGLPGLVIRAGGLAITARAAANKPLRQITGIGAGPNAVEAEAVVTIDAPPEEVWPLISNYPSFPSFMSNVRDVHQWPGSPVTRWTVRGPANADVTFDAEETVREDGHRIGWKTLPGQTIPHAGEITLHGDDGRCQVRVHLHYNPVAGEIGHAVAALFGADAGHQLREDLQRLRDLVESNRSRTQRASA
jgi:uncharacterized membrane protein